MSCFYHIGRSDSHFLLHFAKGLDRQIQILLGMTGGHLGADAVLALGHDRVAEGHHIDALFQHPACKLMGHLGIVQHHRHDGMLAGQQIEAQPDHWPQKWA